MNHIHIWAKFVFGYEVISDVFHCQQGVHRKSITGIENLVNRNLKISWLQVSYTDLGCLFFVMRLLKMCFIVNKDYTRRA